MKRSGFCIALITVTAFVTLFWSRAEISSLSASSPEESTIKQSLSALVSVEAQPDIVNVGQTFSVLVRVDGLSANLSSFQVDLDFDSSVVDFVSSQPGALLGSSGRNVMCPPTARKSLAGIRHACATSGPVPGASSDGPLVLFTFRALAGGHSPLTLSNLVLSDDQRPPGLIGASTMDGGVDVADNFTPVAASDAYTTTEDIPLSQAAPGVLANDEDADDDPLTAELDIGPSYGELILGSDGAFAYTPTLNFNGQDSFTYHANDGLADSNIAVVTLTMTSENDPPVAVADGYATIENIPLNISSPGILANDDDADNDPLSAVLDNGPISGALDLSPDGGFVYTPTQNFSGFDNFSYHAHDGIAGSNIASVAITVTAGQVTDYFVFIPLVLRSTSSTDFDAGGGNSSGGEIISPTSDVEATSSGKANFTPGNKLRWTAGMFFALVLFTWYSAPLRDSVRPKRSTFTRALRRISSHKAFKGLSIIVVMSLVLSAAMPLLPARAQSSTSQTATPAAELPDELSDQNYPQGADNRGVQSAPSSDTGSTGRPPQDIRLVDGYWADLDGDHDVDTADLSIIADFWDCASGDGCYIPQFDYDINDVIDAQDLAWIGNEYDVAPPEISIVAPAEGQVVGTFNVAVDGLVTDTHTVISVTVNNLSANLVGSDFSVNVPMPAGNQTLVVVAEDELGQIGIASRVIKVDGDGPMIEIHEPKDRQAVYSLTPSVVISYTDFYTVVDVSSLSAILIDESGVPSDVTADLAVMGDGASGPLSTPISGDAIYTLTVSLADAYGNISDDEVSFYVPPDPGSISTPAEPANAGWVSGVIYDSSTCNEYLTICEGLPGALVTLAYTGGLPITGTVITGPDGLFAFPVAETGHYWIRVEKENYTYGQRAAEIVREHSSATNEIYLTPMDPAVTYCENDGCTHVSSDGTMEVEIPPGAIAPGQVVTTTATNFEQVEFLPSGELPPGTWETYAFNLGGDSQITFTLPITVRQENSIGFDPGTEIPLGYWNQETLEWEHKGFGVVDPTGQWVEMNVTGFSNYDCNFPVALPDVDVFIDIEDETANDDQNEDQCPASVSGCTVNLKSGTLREEYELPPVQILGEPVAPLLLYNSNRADPSEVIDLRVKLITSDSGYWEDYASFELWIEGIKTDEFWFDAHSLISADGRLRYLWDGRDAQGNSLPPGVYEYWARLHLSYVAQYCGSAYFGGPPDCINFPTNRYVIVSVGRSTRGRIELDAMAESPWGEGWALAEMQRLYEDEAGNIMIADGVRSDAFNFPQKNLLLEEVGETRPADFEASSQGGLLPQDRSFSQSEPTNPINWEGEPDTKLMGSSSTEEGQSEFIDQSAFDRVEDESENVSVMQVEPAAISRSARINHSIVPPRLVTLPRYSETQSAYGTLVSGEISTDTVWTAGTYIVTETVTVLSEVTLTIEPSVTVQFADGSFDLIIAGNLLAAGSEGAPVIFQPQSASAPGSWGQVAFLPGSSGFLSHTQLEYGGADGGMLYLESDLVQVLDSEVRFSADTGIVIHAASPLISGTRILTNTGEHGGGIYNDSGSPIIRNSTIQGNAANVGDGFGGGVYNFSGSPTIENNIIQGNSTNCSFPCNGGSFGGGIYNFSGSPNIRNNVIQDNWANIPNVQSGNGGGIFNDSGTPIVSGNDILTNTARHGGGLYNSSGSPIIQNNTFLRNSVPSGSNFMDGGGGLYNHSGDPLIAENSFLGNSAGNSGGGILNISGMPTILDNSIEGNTAYYGGGIFNYAGNPTIQDNILLNNLADASGGGIRLYNGAAIIQNNIIQGNSGDWAGGISQNYGQSIIQYNTLVGNSAENRGGGIYHQAGSPTIRGNIIVSNTAGSGGGGIYSGGYGPIRYLDYNNVWNNTGGDYLDVVPGLHDISTDPLFVDAVGGDFHLSSGSPGIDAGDPESYSNGDHDGVRRPMGLGPDIGAFEFHTLGIQETSVPPTVGPGETFTYSNRLVNMDSLEATSLVVTDVLPAEVAYLGYQGDGLICTHDSSPWGGTVVCTLGSLLPGNSVTLTIAVEATEALLSPRETTNFVEVIADNTMEASDRTNTWHSWCGVRLNDGPVGSDLQAAINASTQPDDVVKVSGRCLVHDLTLDRTLTLQGGWDHDLNVLDPATYTTTLDAQRLGRVINVTGSNSPTIENFFITGGVAINGGGIYNAAGNPNIRNNHLRANVALFGDGNGSGGGIYNQSGNPIIQDNLIVSNTAYYGGAIYNNAGNPQVQYNSFLGNWTYSNSAGGGIYNYKDSPIIQNNTFQDNASTNGGGIYHRLGNPNIENNFFLGNTARYYGGGIGTYSGNPTIRYNTFFSNTAASGGGGGIYSENGNPTIWGNIVVGNTANQGGGIYHWNYGLPILDWNNVWDNHAVYGYDNYFGILSGPNDISVNPQFVDPQGGDLNLSAGSPCIDTGDPDNHPVSDREGDPRPMGLGIDIGADEFRTLGTSKNSIPDTVSPGETFTYTITLFNLDSVEATDVVLTDVLRSEVTLLSYQIDGLGCDLPSANTISCTLASLPVGTRENLTITVQAADSLPSPVLLSNIVTASTGNGLQARDQTNTWISWCNVRLNDGMVGHDIQTAINASTQSTDVVKVSGRCLEHDILLNKELTLQGGWKPDFSGRITATNHTTLDAERMGRVFEVSGNISPVIEDFVITNGLSGAGGGIYINGSNPIVQSNTFQGNMASTWGGGIYINQSSSVVLNNTFLGNAAYNGGGGIYIRYGDPTIASNAFRNNSATDGGGIFTNGGSSSIVNNRFQGNMALTWGGGLHSSAVDDARYNTFYDNSAGYTGGAIYVTGIQMRTIRSNIVVSNTAENGGGVAISGPFFDLDFNDIWSNEGGDYWGTGVTPGPNDISVDPLFLNPISGDLHLTAGSSCIDAGDPNDFPETDYEGDPRPIGTAPDIGADEFLTQNPASLTETDHSWLEWDASSSTYTRIYPDGKQVHFNPDGTHDYTLEPSGRLTTYTYNPNRTVATMGIVLPGEETPRWVWAFQYTDGVVSSIVNPAGRVSTLFVDLHNQLTSIIDPDGAARQYTYNQDDLLTQFTDENGNVTTYGYDGYGRVADITEQPRTVYDQASGQISVVQEVREFIPSDTGYVLFNNRETGDPDNPGPPVPFGSALWDRIYFARGLREGHTNRWGYWLDEADGEGRTTYYQRDEANNLTRIDYPDGSCVTYTYDELGNRLTETQMDAARCAGFEAPLEAGQSLTRTFTYEERFNQIRTRTDPLSNTITYIYDYEEGVGEAGNLIRIEYPPVPDEHGTIVVPTVSFSYNEWGQVASETDPLGTVTKYAYTQGTPDEAYGQPGALFAEGVTPVPGILTQIILDFGGLNETTTYKDFNGTGYPQIVIGSNEAVTAYSYDSWGRVLTELNAIGIVTKLEYDGLGNLVKRTQDYTPDGTTGRNVVTLYTYDPENRMLSERTAADGLEVGTVYRYDINGKLATQTDGNGNTTIYSYDDADQLVAVTDPLGYSTTYSYTLTGQVEKILRPDGTVDKQVYNAFGHLENGIIDYGGLDLTTTYSYDLNDNVLAVSDPAGTTNCFEYDALNRLVTEIKDCGGLNLTTNYSYDLAGNLLLRTDPQGVSYRHQYDTLGRENQLILDDGGLNIIGQYEHDSAGSLVGVTDDQGNVYTLEYDDLKRVTRICEDVTGPNLCTSYAYDELGNRATATDPNGITTFTTYNDFGLASEVVKDYGGMAAVTRYGYDNALNLAQIDDANGNKTNYVYTARNERSMEMYADGSTVNYSHDARGFVQDRTDQDGSTVSYQYDGAGRLMQREFSTGGNHSFTFDQAGRMTSAMETLVDRESLITVGLNSLGDVISTTESIDGQSWSVHYDYDYSGSVYTITYPSGAQRVYTLDPLKRISTVQNGAGIPIATYDYRDVDGYGTLAYANGTINRTDFDALGRITSITSDMGDYRYGYDAAGNRTYMKRAHLPGQPSDVYQYDDLYQLEQVWYGADATDPSAISNYESIQGYNLDMLRNRLEVNDNGNVEVYLPNDGYQLTNQMNRYEQVDDRVFAYDGRGNTLDDGLNTYSYDILNRQTSVSGPASNAEYIYNAAGWRIAKMVDGVTTYYAQDVNGQVLEERTADGNMSALYTYGLAIDQPLTMERDGSTYYYHRDAQGSITEVTDSGGNLVEQYTYDIYGAAKIYDGTGDPLSDSAIGNPYLYTARRYDPESSNYYFRARYYTPATGRFLQMDPVGYVDGMNLYASYFVLNSTDPSGLKFAVELFKGDIHGGLGGSLSVEVEFDFKDCCVGGTSIEDGERTYTLKIAATFGLGLGAAAKVVGTGVSLGVSGPELVGEGAFSAKNTECGGPVNTLEHCRSAGIDLGAKGNIGAIAYTFEVAYKVQGQLKLCGSIGTGKASIDLSFCGTLTLELNQQIGPLKLPIWKHKNSIEDQCISLVKRSWPLPE